MVGVASKTGLGVVVVAVVVVGGDGVVVVVGFLRGLVAGVDATFGCAVVVVAFLRGFLVTGASFSSGGRDGDGAKGKRPEPGPRFSGCWQ